MIKLTNDEIQALIESIGGNMNHIGELDGKIVPMNNTVGSLHCIDDLMLINQQRDRIAQLEEINKIATGERDFLLTKLDENEAQKNRIAELEREKAELVAQVESQNEFIESVMANIGARATIGEIADMLCDWWDSRPTSTQFLNQIKAEAVLQFSASVLVKYRYDLIEWAKEYAASIAKGE